MREDLLFKEKGRKRVCGKKKTRRAKCENDKEVGNSAALKKLTRLGVVKSSPTSWEKKRDREDCLRRVKCAQETRRKGRRQK